MEYEKTQKGNPHRLTVKQHCFPMRSIERFACSDGLVDVQRGVKNFRLKPDHKLFVLEELGIRVRNLDL